MVRRVFNKSHEIGCHSYQHEALRDAICYIPGEYRVMLPEEVTSKFIKT